MHLDKSKFQPLTSIIHSLNHTVIVIDFIDLDKNYFINKL